jgi:redox-sensitive bicupin YhaK (pirin superfamily)
MSDRTVRAVIPAVEALEGGGFLVHRPFPTRALDHFDPFLLLDEMGPADSPPGEAKGAPDHPHRGFETVTYLLSGEMEHKDSRGHAGRLTPGDVQWMTAGAGVVHSEMPSAAFQARGGKMHGFQLWVNLPAKDKMMRPRYQEIPAAQIPLAEADGGRVKVRVIAGESLGHKAVIDTRTPIFYLHFTLATGGRVSQPVPEGWNVFAYVVSGTGRLGGDRREARDHQMAMFDGPGDAIAIENDGPAPLEVLLLGGLPLGEPVARYGPFVMNTEQEIYDAFRDYRAGHFGEIG